MSTQLDIRDDDPLTTAVVFSKKFVQRHYIVSLTWVIGLLVVTLAKGYTVDSQTKVKFEMALHNAEDIRNSDVDHAHRAMQGAYDRYRSSKGWFWRCDEYCESNYESYLKSQDQFEIAKKRYENAMADARKTVGIFSEYGVDDARNLFWKSWENGKNFAKRISYYDAIFLVFDSRNESFWAYVIQVILRCFFNFTIGFTSALISFLWDLIWFVKSYSSGIIGILFWILAASAAFSVFATTITAMFATLFLSSKALIHYGTTREALNQGRNSGQYRGRVNYYHRD